MIISEKIILYLMSDGFEEIFLVLSSLLFITGHPLPVTAVQLLWINIVADGFPHLALTIDPKNKNIMKLPPRSSHEPLIANWMKIIVLIVSFTGGLIAFLLFNFSYKHTQDLTFAQSMAFATIGINSLIYVFSIRTLRASFWEENIFANKWLLLAVFGGLFFQALPFINIPFGKFMGVKPLGWWWLLVIGSSVVMFLVIEVLKEVFDFAEQVKKRKF